MVNFVSLFFYKGKSLNGRILKNYLNYDIKVSISNEYDTCTCVQAVKDIFYICPSSLRFH